MNKNLVLSDIGIEGDENVSIFESLTRTNRVILKTALTHKRNKIIRSAFTLRGNVYIRVNDKDDAVVVNDLVKLDSIVGNLLIT